MDAAEVRDDLARPVAVRRGDGEAPARLVLDAADLGHAIAELRRVEGELAPQARLAVGQRERRAGVPETWELAGRDRVVDADAGVGVRERQVRPELDRRDARRVQR